MKRAATIICMLMVCASTNHVFGNGASRDGLSARSAGRAGTNLGFADNGAVLHDNVAGMTNFEGLGMIDTTVTGLITDLDYSDPDNARTGAYDNLLPMGDFGMIRRSADGNFAYGLGTFSPAGFSAQYNLQGPAPFTGTRNYKSYAALARVLPAVAIQATDKLSVGATLGVAVSHVELEGPYFIQQGVPTALTGVPVLMDLQTTGAALTWSVGMQYKLTDCTTIGVNYQSENRMNMDGNARLVTQALGQTYYDLDLRLTWPRAVGVGFKHDICEHRRLSMDVNWLNWQRAFDDASLRLSDATNDNYTNLFGPVVHETMPLNWRDSVSFRTGYEHEFGDNKIVRMGYVFHRNPMPTAFISPFIQTTLEHTVSTGYGFEFCDIGVDVAYQFSWDRRRDINNSGYGGGDFDGSRIRTLAHWVLLEFSKQF